MNIFRSEEHVKRWSLYYRMAEDYIMPVTDWAQVFSGPLFRRRLEADYLTNADAYFSEYQSSLRNFGKQSPFWQYPMIAGMDIVKLPRYAIVGKYTRFEEQVLNELKDAKQSIVSSLADVSSSRKNFLIWAAPGSGKTFFAQQIAAAQGQKFDYREINLAQVREGEFVASLAALVQSSNPLLCLIDEIDAKPHESWPYDVLLPYLDASLTRHTPLVLIMAGSSGFSLQGMKERMAVRPKGHDLLSRIPAENQFIIPPMSFGDRILIVLSQFAQAGHELGHEINFVEKLGLYYVALNEQLANARQLHEFAVRAVERVPHGDDRVKYDNLFVPGDPENKRFWLEVSSVAQELVNSYVTIEE
ncbi:MAG: AAA family ATPase [Chloroflexota bacterium]|nr:MAG: AAA family ATPase [Chloroflexota bacterium]